MINGFGPTSISKPSVTICGTCAWLIVVLASAPRAVVIEFDPNVRMVSDMRPPALYHAYENIALGIIAWTPLIPFTTCDISKSTAMLDSA